MSNVTVQTRTIGGVTLQCISGFVNLFRFITQPSPGTVIGQLQTTTGGTIPLIQTSASSPSLASVDGQFATLCGRFVASANRTVFDVRVVIPSAQPQPQPVNTQLLLLLLILLLLSSRSGVGSLQSASISNLLNQLGAGGLQGAQLSSLLGQLGLSGQNANLATLTNLLQGSI